MIVIPFKRGDHFLLPGEVIINDAAQDLSAWTIRCHARHSNGFVVRFTVDKSTTLGQYLIKDLTTQDWPLGALHADIEYTTDDGTVISTETFQIDVLKDETR